MKNPIVHGVIVTILFAIPIFTTSFPAIANLTIGGVLAMLAHWLDGKSQVNFGKSFWH